METNRFGTMFEDLDRSASERTSRRIFDAPSPDTAVSALNTAPSMGLDPDALIQDPAALQQIQRSDYDTKALSGRPDLRNFVDRSTTNAALAQDELPELGFFENAQKWLSESSQELFGWNRRDDLQSLPSRAVEGATTMATGAFQTTRGVRAGKNAMEAIEAINIMQSIMQGEEVTAEMANNPAFLRYGVSIGGEGGSFNFLSASEEQRQALIQRAAGAFVESDEQVRDAALMVALMRARTPDGPELSFDNIGEIIAFYGIQSAAIALPALMTSAVSAPAGITAMATTGYVTGYAAATEQDILEDGPAAFYSRDTHNKGLIVAPIFAATEFLGPVGRVIRRPFADISEDLMIRALRARSLPAKSGAVLAAGALEEGTAELLQEMLVDWGNGELEWTKEGIEGYLQSFAVGALVGGPITAGIEVPALAAQARRNEQAQRDGLSNGVLQQIQDQAGDIKMRERSPEKWREFLQSIGTEQGRMYVEPTVLQDAVSAGTVDLETLGVTQEALDTAVEAGGRVQVKQIDWAANYAGKEAGQSLLENSSARADGYTPAQLRNFQDLVAEANAESTFNAEQIKELDQRTSDLRTERRLAMKREGMSNAEASANANLQASAVRTLAQRTGDMGIFDQFQLNIEGTSALGKRQAADVVERRFDQAPPKVRGSSAANSGNKHGLMPHLRSTTAPPPPDRTKALVLAKTNNANADRQLQGVDQLQERHPDPAASVDSWNAMMADALASDDVPVPPYKFLSDVNSGGAVQMLQTLSEGQIKDADHGFDNAREFREAYTNGEVTIADTGKLFLWSFLSRGVSPYTQESLFLDAFDGIAPFIEQAAAGNLDLDAYYEWAATTAPKGSGQSGSGAIHNLNAFGRDFLTRMSQDSGDGRSRLQVLHDMMGDPEATGQQVRREFARIGESVGIDNKVVSFTLLVAGFTDVMVLDRVQIRNLWNDGRFDGINLYDGYKVDGKAVTGSGLATLTNGVRGLMIYEAIEQSLSARIDAIYTEVGRPDAASIGRYHWETWVAASQQEASHGTIDAILRQIKGDQQPLGGVTAKEGEYGSYAYGARYGIDADGQSYFLYEVPASSPDQPPLGLYKFDVASFVSFQTEIKKPAAGVVPRGRFRVTEAGNEPWYFQEGVSLDALNTVAGDFGTAVDPEQIRPVDVKNGVDQNVTDRPAADQPSAARALDQGGIERGIQEPEQRYSGGGEAGRQLPALEGAPTVRGVSGPDPRLVAVAEKYAADNGIWLERQDEFVEVDPERAARIADAYEKMKHDPQDPVVAEAYQNMIDQTIAQYNALIADGYEFYFIDLNSPEGQEYASSPFNAMFELRNDKRMGVFATDEGFGTDQAFDPADNPMLAETGFLWPMGPEGTPQTVYANDLFRAVHDAFGHGLEFAGFRARGEENAWQAHVRLFTGSAVAAITTETRGQNSWLNYGPHGENNRTAKVEDTIFADQKTGLMPEFTWSEGKAGPRTFDQSAPQDYDPNTITVAETGEPLRVYHGTVNDFDEFSDGMIFMSSRRGLAVEHAMRAPKAAGRTPRVIEATVAFENPLIVGPVDTDTDVYWLQNSMSLERQMRDFDGLLVYNNDGEVLVIAKRNDQVTQQPPAGQRQLDQPSTESELDLDALIAEFEGVAAAPLQSIGEVAQQDRAAALQRFRADRDAIADQLGNRAGAASWTSERIGRVIRQYEHGYKDESKARIGFVDPLSFVAATSRDIGKIAEEAGELDLAELQEQSQTPFLIVEDGKIVGHEGRHRMMAMARAGVRFAPVAIEYRGQGYTKEPQRDGETFEGQTFDDGPSVDLNLTVIDTIAATSSNKAAIQQLMGPAPNVLYQTIEGPLGRITLPDNVKTGESLIQLFEGSNPTTMAHEFGHYLIEVMRVIGEGDGAPQSITDDLATVHAWMEEVTGQPVDGPYNTAQQEAWAEAWENYLMSGKAPSPSLKTVFRKFALWMAQVYKTAVGAGTQPSPEIRGVMDRLLATDQEIAVTQMENADLDLFTEKPPYMTQTEWDTYTRVAERGDAEAHGKTLGAAMEAERKKQGKAWKAAYKAALQQAREDLAEQREYVLIDALGNKSNDFGLGARLDRDTLVSMFGKAILDDLKALKAGQLIYVKDGADPDQVADMFGFRNGAEMIQSLRATRPLEEQAQINARAVANEDAPQLTDAELREVAEAALKNPTRIERVSREAATLSKASGGVASSWTVMNRAAKERATQLVGEMNVQQAGNYRQFAVAARKAAREAQAQLAKVVRLADGTPTQGGMEAMRKAADAKRQQLLNDHMYTIARERAKTFDKARARFKKAQTKKQRLKIDPNYMDQVDALLDQYDFVQRTKAELVTMQRERKALAQFQMDIDEAGMGSELSISPTVLARAGAGKVNYNELTVDQMEAVVDTIDNLIHAGKGVQKSYLENETLMYGEMVNEITLEMARSMKGTPRPDRESGQRSGLPKFLGALNQNIETALTTIRRMDGWKDNGPAMRYIFRPLQRAAAAVEERREQETVRLKEVYSKHYSKKEIRALNDKRTHGIYVPELGGTFSKAGLLSIALNSGNAGNFQRLTDVEGVQGDGAYDATRVNAALKAHLTQKDWRFVQDMWDHIDSFWPEISKLEREVTGVVPAKVEAVLQVDAPDFVKGGYYPIQYDKDLNIASFLSGADDAYKDATGGRHGKAQTRHGHTEERLNSTGMALDLNLGVAENHIMKVTHDLAMRKPINHAVKVLNNPLIGQTLNQFGRPADLDALRSWLVDTAAGDSISADSMGAVMRYARKALTVKYIGFSLATLILQPFGAIQAGVVVGNRDLASGYTKYMGRAKYWNNFIQTNSAHMRLRVRAVNREVNEFAREARTAETAASGPLNRWTNAITSVSLAPIGQIQYWTVDIPVFIAAFEKARGEGKSEADAISLAENAVDRASGSGSFLNRAAFERGTSSNSARRTEYIKTFTMLASYVHSKYNAAVEAKGRTDFSSPLETLLFTGSMIQLFAIEAALVTAYRAIGDERDDDEPTGKWLASIVGSEVLGLHPVTRPFSSYVSGYGTGSVPMSDFADLLAKGASGTIDIAAGEGDLNDWLRAFDAGATPFMLPTGQMKKIIRALVADDPSTQLGRVALGLAPERE